VSAVKAGQSATITFTFSEDPGATFSWDGTSGDVAVSGGVLGAISGTGLTRSATFTPAAGSTVSGVVSVASGKFADAAGNTNSAASNTVTLAVDTVVPTIAISSDKASVKA
jgi:hypothetical protein